uniref:Immunoglobulin V-set domain-containing protein n=1 Tax=Sparus aurata TaxID=8175 RepID=A0A671WP70_SPAAU
YIVFKTYVSEMSLLFLIHLKNALKLLQNKKALCYGALGGTVVLRLMDSTSEIHRYQWFKNTTLILRGIKNSITFNQLETRSSFTPSDGTFRINNLSRTDDGEYTLTIYEKSGRLLDPQILQVNIQGK